jgi:L-2,4-diaminobutyrate decarboxylase
VEPRHRELLRSLRVAFPQPVSDQVHDGYVVFSVLRALDQVDALKSQAPLLGAPRETDFDAALAEKLSAVGSTVEQVTAELVDSLQGMPIFGHPCSQVNIVACPSIPSIVGVVLPSMYNPNLCSDESGAGFSETEVKTIAIVADMIGYDPQEAGGLFTFGGTGALLYGVKIGLEKALPGCFTHGIRQDVTLLTSEHGHYAALNAASWLGIGQQHVVRVATHNDNSIKLEELETAARQALDQGRPIAAIIATLGTTDAFGLDDLQAIVELRDRLVDEYQLPYRIHIHADAVIGWAWSVFNDYDFTKNSLQFRPQTLRSLAATSRRIEMLKLADSVGIDFHKTGFAPYISSLFLLRDRNEWAHVSRQRDTMPYLFHSGQYHPGMFSLETTRAATGPMAAFASLRLLGKEGFATLLGHAVEMAELLRELVSAQAELTVLNRENHGPVTLIRAYPDGFDHFQAFQRELQDSSLTAEVERVNEFNRRIFRRLHDEAMQGKGVALGLTDAYRHTAAGTPIVAIKSYVLSPFVEESQMEIVLERILTIRQEVAAEF